MQGIGIDIADLKRIETLVSQYDKKTLGILYGADEFCWFQENQQPHYYAISFSGKEAVAKALGTGIGGLHWFEICVLPLENNTFKVLLSGNALQCAERQGICHWHGYWSFLKEHLCITVAMMDY